MEAFAYDAVEYTVSCAGCQSWTVATRARTLKDCAGQRRTRVSKELIPSPSMVPPLLKDVHADVQGGCDNHTLFIRSIEVVLGTIAGTNFY
jgi:hypothetical protein